MLRSPFARVGALALMAVASASVHGPLRAQGAQAQIQLAFGYDCGDRFVIRNDGAQDVDVEYDVQGSGQRSPLHINAKQALEINSPSNDPVELWVNGKLVATEPKGNRACAPDQGSQVVVVRPLYPEDYVTYVRPAPYYYVAPPVYYGYPPFYGYRSASISVVLPFFSNYGGRGYGRGRPVFRGYAHRR